MVNKLYEAPGRAARLSCLDHDRARGAGGRGRGPRPRGLAGRRLWRVGGMYWGEGWAGDAAPEAASRVRSV